MKKLLALTAIALLAFSVSASAQVDPDPDGMGIYFDMGATQFNVAYTGTFTPLNVYLLITRPSGDFVRAWECTIVESNTFTVAGTWALNGGLDVDNDPMDFVVGTGAAPHPAAPAVMLASKQMFGMPTSTATFLVKGVAGSVSFPGGQPGYVHTLGFNTPCQVPTGDMNAPQACVNSNCMVVANEDMSWSNVKALY
ncbi:MAG: hypothetical protein IPH09_13715 [bacterium]|nr:hypothetical protein [bacterium]